MPPIVNVAAYKFAPLEDLKPLRKRLLDLCKPLGLRGTILISTEGVNLFVAGVRESVDTLLAELRSLPGLAGLEVKESESARQPFNRMLVRIKREIIAFGVEGIDPSRRTSPKLAPRELKRWLDEGRPVTLLDTRNDYEIKLGTFQNARTLGIDHFREFPRAVAQLPEEWKRQPVVMFCTGGIRCEKAGPYMEREGFEQIYQLEGGILKYFEDCGAAHYDGECFVFDQRVGLDAGLSETESDQCFACLTPLTAEDQLDPRYVKGSACPYCMQSTEAQRAQTLVERHEALRRATDPLPGSTACDNYRPLNIPAAAEGRVLTEFLAEIFPRISEAEWREACRSGRLLDADRRPVEESRVVRAGERFLNLEPAAIEPDVNADVRIIYEDEAIVVVDKPAPLPLHPSGRFHRNTLQAFLHAVYAPQRPRPAHRLDANTAGVVVFARTRHFAGIVQPEFARGNVEKVYLARVQGSPSEELFECTAPISTEAGELGSRCIDEQNGASAHTKFAVLDRFDDGTTLLEVRPLTGRTNQIRVHLWHLGLPICGEQAYLPDRALGSVQTNDVDDPPLNLLAYQLSFKHPLSGERVTFFARRPEWSLSRDRSRA
ncbi:MAG: sulfurtransferase [Pirellula sp.]|nr:sulfurtransferase [Pirellula sp.]